MCKFFSFVGDGYGNYLYSDWEARKTNINENWDSHTFILTNAKVPVRMQDRWSKYEFNPLTKAFTVDKGVDGHDHNDAEQWVNKLNFKSIIECLVIKPIINPLQGEAKKATDKEIELLKQWTSVRDSVGDSVWASVGSSVRDSVGALVGDSVRDSVGDSVWDSVGALVGDSVRDSVGDSVWDSVGDSVWAYISSFFDIAYKYDFSSLLELWDHGFVPSFDGKTGRLHSGENAEIVYEWIKEL